METIDLEMVEAETTAASRELVSFAERKVIERLSADNEREVTTETMTKDVIRTNIVRVTSSDMWRQHIAWSARKNRRLTKATNTTNSTLSSTHLVGRTSIVLTNQKV
jgi:hypothetical protein